MKPAAMGEKWGVCPPLEKMVYVFVCLCIRLPAPLETGGQLAYNRLGQQGNGKPIKGKPGRTTGRPSFIGVRFFRRNLPPAEQRSPKAMQMPGKFFKPFRFA